MPAAAFPSPASSRTSAGAGLIAVPGAAPLDCLFASTWLLVSDEVLAGRGVRAWMVVSPKAAAGPGDRSVPAIRLTADRVSALGVCAPEAPGEPAPWSVTVWRARPDGPSVVAARLDIPAGVQGGLLLPSAPAGTGASETAASPPTSRPRGSTHPGPSASATAGTAAASAPTDPGATPAPPAQAPRDWTSGRYVLEIAAGGAAPLWLGVDVASTP